MLHRKVLEKIYNRRRRDEREKEAFLEMEDFWFEKEQDITSE